MRQPTIVNFPIFNSIPIDKGLKNYILKFYLNMVRCNGDQYACDKMKQLRERCLYLRSLPDRPNPIGNRRLPKQFLLPLRKKSMARKLLMYLECSPHHVLALLKIYIRPSGKPIMTVEESAANQHHTLKEADKIKTFYGRRMIEDFLDLFKEKTSSEYRKAKILSRKYMSEGSNRKQAWQEAWTDIVRSRLLGSALLAELPDHTKVSNEALGWWNRWSKIFRQIFSGEVKTDETIAASSVYHFPRPVMYNDLRVDGTSFSFQKDLVKTLLISQICKRTDDGTYRTDRECKAYVNILMSHLSYRTGKKGKEVFDLWSNLDDKERISLMEDFEKKSKIREISSVYHWIVQNFMSDDMQDLSVEEVLSLWPTRTVDWDDIAFGPCGQIQHIPKKGTIKRRPIAVPNRFLQFVLRPAKQALLEVLSKFDRDCTKNQGKYDSHILGTLENGGYVGSVDLSQATDNLPYDWVQPFIDRIYPSWDQDVKNSFTAFTLASRTYWNNNGSPDRWTVGQPLGTFPSFNILALTHNLILESLSASCGEFNSPYVVLGDDVVMTSRRVRRSYIQLMDISGIPLSLHKSYENNLVEFAGKIFIKRQPAFYSSDHNKIRFDNLFDYVRATGIPIPWENLSEKTRKSFTRQFHSNLRKDRKTFLRLRDTAETYAPEGARFIPCKNGERNITLGRMVNLLQYILANEKRCNCGKHLQPTHDHGLVIDDPLEQLIFVYNLCWRREKETSGAIATMLEDFVYVKIGTTFQCKDEEGRGESIFNHQCLSRSTFDELCDGWIPTPDCNGPTDTTFSRECERNPGFIRDKLLVCRDRLNRRYRNRIDRSERNQKNQRWFIEKFRPQTVDQLLVAIFILMKMSIN